MNLDLILSNATACFKTWKTITFAERQSLLIKLAETLKENKTLLSENITKEMHKPISQSIAEIEKCIWMIKYYAEAPENALSAEKVETEFGISEIRYEPKGVILGVMPWNFPFWQVLRFVVPAVLAGNVTLLKHASICFSSGNLIEKMFDDAGFPKGVFQNMEIGHDDVKKVLAHPAVQGVSLTGSEKAGAEVAATAAKNIKKSLLELGGSDAFIVLNDADLHKAAAQGSKARLQNCGQACNAAKRFIIQKDIEPDFMPLFIKEYQKYIPGDAMDKTTLIAGMARADLADDLEKQYEMAKNAGAEVLLPLVRLSDISLQPGLIKVKSGNPILKEEVFGPLGMVLIADDDAHALALANDIPFGLSNSVWTKDQDRQNFFIEGLESGTVSVNKASSSDPRLPFGGAKSSGYGVELSLHALKEFVNVKTVVGN